MKNLSLFNVSCLDFSCETVISAVKHAVKTIDVKIFEMFDPSLGKKQLACPRPVQAYRTVQQGWVCLDWGSATVVFCPYFVFNSYLYEAVWELTHLGERCWMPQSVSGLC